MQQKNFLIPRPPLAELQRSDAVSAAPTTSGGQPQTPLTSSSAPACLTQACARIEHTFILLAGKRIQDFDLLQPPHSALALSSDPNPGPASVS